MAKEPGEDFLRISATVTNRPGSHEATVETDGATTQVAIPPKEAGPGSSVNGGELLFLALATCYCNDVYREAATAGLSIEEVTVSVVGHFGGRGEPARDVTFDVRVRSPESPDAVRELLRETDRVAEIQNSLRRGVGVTLGEVTLDR